MTKSVTSAFPKMLPLKSLHKKPPSPSPELPYKTTTVFSLLKAFELLRIDSCTKSSTSQKIKRHGSRSFVGYPQEQGMSTYSTNSISDQIHHHAWARQVRNVSMSVYAFICVQSTSCTELTAQVDARETNIHQVVKVSQFRGDDSSAKQSRGNLDRPL